MKCIKKADNRCFVRKALEEIKNPKPASTYPSHIESWLKYGPKKKLCKRKK